MVVVFNQWIIVKASSFMDNNSTMYKSPSIVVLQFYNYKKKLNIRRPIQNYIIKNGEML